MVPVSMPCGGAEYLAMAEFIGGVTPEQVRLRLRTERRRGAEANLSTLEGGVDKDRFDSDEEPHASTERARIEAVFRDVQVLGSAPSFPGATTSSRRDDTLF
jgi:hypothetical protein